MASPEPPPGPTPKAPVPPNAPPKQNPVFKMMGLPNLRLRLPSRNWMIFLSVTGSLTGAILYDKHETKKAREKWCTLVSHLAREPLSPKQMPRKITIYLAAPPTDGLRPAREHFAEYVRPVLMAGAVEWDVVEGRREGDVRLGTAEKIRRYRRRIGETSDDAAPKEPEQEDILHAIRQDSEVSEWDGTQGDIVIGRHTWKEYIRGLHEGWLGPLDPPPPPPPSPVAEDASPSPPDDTLFEAIPASEQPSDDSSPTAPISPPEPEPTPAATPPPAPQITLPVSSYPSATLPASIPSQFDPATPIPLPTIYGFLHTPTRFYRFLNRRRLADDVGRDVAAVVLAAYSRPFSASASDSASAASTPDSSVTPSELSADPPSPSSSPSPSPDEQQPTEQHTLLAPEEAHWHKSIFKRAEGEPERTWLEPIVLDARIAGRMRRFEISAEDAARAERIARGEEGARDEGRGEGV